MTLKLKKHPNDVEPQTSFAAGAPSEPNNAVDSRNVLVTHGIHRGRFPVGGMRVREARQVLEKLINIDPGAVPVINGSPVDENQIINGNVTMLSFVKPSALKG